MGWGTYPGLVRGKALLIPKWYTITLIMALAMCAGCLEFHEEITINEDGQTLVEVRVSGVKSDPVPMLAMPTSPPWTHSWEEDADHPGQQILRAEQLLLPGQPFPASFAADADPRADQQLQFPTVLRTWTAGDTTFFEFRRNYRARRMARFLGTVVIEQELENRVLENGIFNVSQNDRDKYLTLLSHQTNQLYMSFLQEALGSLVEEGSLDLVDRQWVLEQGIRILATTLNPTVVLEILSLDDEAMGQALEKTTSGIFREFSQTIRDRHPRAELLLAARLEEIRSEYDISNRISNSQFSIKLKLPGVILHTNGLIDSSDPASIGWHFAGEDLLDRGIELHAVSAVTNRQGRPHE